MRNGIGQTLREARERRRLSLDEVEAATKIRLRFLRAMEAEEWDVLPGGAYDRAFLRTYATFLGLDGERISEEFRHAEQSGRPTAPLPAGAVGERAPRRRPSGLAVAAVLAVVLVATIVAVGSLAGGGKDEGGRAGARAPGKAKGGKGQPSAGRSEERQPPAGVEMRLVANAEVWACVLNDSGEPLVDGEILEPGTEAGPFHSRAYTAAFGNGEFELEVEGEAQQLPASASPVGYAIESTGGVSPIEEGERPTCE